MLDVWTVDGFMWQVQKVGLNDDSNVTLLAVVLKCHAEMSY